MLYLPASIRNVLPKVIITVVVVGSIPDKDKLDDGSTEMRWVEFYQVH